MVPYADEQAPSGAAVVTSAHVQAPEQGHQGREATQPVTKLRRKRLVEAVTCEERVVHDPAGCGRHRRPDGPPSSLSSSQVQEESGRQGRVPFPPQVASERTARSHAARVGTQPGALRDKEFPMLVKPGWIPDAPFDLAEISVEWHEHGWAGAAPVARRRRVPIAHHRSAPTTSRTIRRIRSMRRSACSF
jgi:hypothetical protein